jgi:taurine dioxygenase
MQIKRLSGAVGAEILGVDLVGKISDALIADIRKIWLENGVIFFRDQNMTMDQFRVLPSALARSWNIPL